MYQPTTRRQPMIVNVGPMLSILFGILILVFPRLLNYLVAIYLILAGFVGLGVVMFR
jgi:hypothetical protein